MDKDSARDYLPLVQALAGGKTLQVKDMDGNWCDNSSPIFDLTADRYRIKPSPRSLFTVEVQNSGEWCIVAYRQQRFTAEDELRYRQGPNFPPARIVEYVEKLD